MAASWLAGWLGHVNQVKTMQLTVNCVRLSSAQFSPLVWPMPQWHIQDLNSFTSLLVTQQFIHRTHLVSVQVSLFGRHRIALFMAMSFAYPAWLMTSSGSGNGSIRPANSPTSLRFFIARPFVNHFASTWNRPLFVSWRKTQPGLHGGAQDQKWAWPGAGQAPVSTWPGALLFITKA